MGREELYRSEAYRKAQWLAYEKHLADLEQLRELTHACEQAAQVVLVLRTQMLEAQLDFRGSELGWHAQRLAREFELVDSFRSVLRTIIREVTDPRQAVKQIQEKLKHSPCESIDWTRFDTEFQMTYPEFQSKLLQRYPELTGMLTKVCALLRLKLSSADIAKLLCMSVRKVEGYRLHISKTMDLTKGQDVHAALARM